MKGLFTLSILASVVFASLSPSENLEIRNKLSLYALAVDNKQFGLLDNIFTQDIFADYVGQTYSGLPAFKAFLNISTANKTTQHAISSTILDDGAIAGLGNSQSPNSTAYVVATFLGQGNLTGTSLALYGKYLDSWVRDQGAWKIKRRVFTLFVSITREPHPSLSCSFALINQF